MQSARYHKGDYEAAWQQYRAVTVETAGIGEPNSFNRITYFYPPRSHVMAVKIGDVIQSLEEFAPRPYQETYDNSGLLTGTPDSEARAALVTLDCTEEIVEEAILKGCNLIVAHHPILFKPIRSLVPTNYVTRTLTKATKHEVAIYAIHTNLDNVAAGVNQRMAEQLHLSATRVLAPRTDTLSKLVTFVPPSHLDAVVSALYAAGAGQVGDYSDCSFQVKGAGTFTPGANARPHLGAPGQPERTEEVRVEVLVPRHKEAIVLTALRKAHPYQEVAHYITHLQNENQEVGAGLIGRLPEPMEAFAFLALVKSAFRCKVLRHTAPVKRQVHTIALCGGSGSFLLPAAIRAGADAYISADFKYHEFFDADGRILVADPGHYESEQFTPHVVAEVLRQKFPTFAVNFSEIATNPIHYL
jgi:dinuclear metal center YbgI/SA1388 family protein